MVGELKVLIPLAGLIDKEAELTRLNKEITRLNQDIERTEKKLNNANFVDNAPAAVVQKERNKLEENRSAVAKLQAQAKKIRAL